MVPSLVELLFYILQEDIYNCKMPELSDLCRDLHQKLKAEKEPHAEQIAAGEGLDFNSAVDSLEKNALAQEHLSFVYQRLTGAHDVFAGEVVYMQLQYETIHELRRRLQKRFADTVLGIKKQ